jgi:hypothetical protein
MMLRRVLGEGFALFCAIMLGLAAGALWLVPTVLLRRPLPELALVIGWLLALAIRQWVHAGKWNAALLAAMATIAACAYIRVLTVASDISAMMGYGLVEVMRTAGSSMLFALARLGLTTGELVWDIVGILVAVAVSLRNAPRRAQSNIG